MDGKRILVQKFGGTSVADTEKIKNVARRIAETRSKGYHVVAVISALGDTTDRLVELAYQITPRPRAREMDMLLATGEQISVALLSMAMHELGHEAISFTGAQVGIVTDSAHTKAKILDVKVGRILEELEKGSVVIVAGFQGVSLDDQITTLGRGGSDTTAVALAAALGAEVCEIYTDVDGVYTADPRLVPEARKLSRLSYEEMLEMAATGARVLQLRSVEFARNYGVVIHVRSSFSQEEGTWITEEDERMEKAIISGVTHDVSEAKVTVFDVPDRPGVAAALFKALAAENINVDMIIQNVSENQRTDISFTVSKEDLQKAEEITARVAEELGAGGVSVDRDIAKVSLVGAGMRTHPGVAADMFAALAENDINIEMISTSTIKISCVIRAEDVEKAVRAIHAKFGLDRGVVMRA
ncbi:aspartate kinase [Candidatus Solincola tengchongensis]|uniref:aspartate kinase n=1 Tax=Candidatus Solincola tengchongensis TaxID=2900693 RepID=UPI002579A098|nr:aspartate kinase [Candidatus Solincola tengchongensis]